MVNGRQGILRYEMSGEANRKTKQAEKVGKE